MTEPRLASDPAAVIDRAYAAATRLKEARRTGAEDSSAVKAARAEAEAALNAWEQDSAHLEQMIRGFEADARSEDSPSGIAPGAPDNLIQLHQERIHAQQR